ncbi:hypothetical protein [Phenylobacterium montanum]|uniref:Uncharacterized protein n=1 Tax=Phenylobacterium montanum TaxID=2823693 RepID=A0A975G3L8_9CAUL|nr:hypothetical protein [Caulobacter sp. S6]QUD89892.1 hypothetical protein KCG34_08520 [Caulobacter sp. S6]
MKSAHNPAATASTTVAFRFRAEIEQATAQGVPPGDMALHLTLRDVALLQRDPAVPVADISFAGGTMTFLGVTIHKGEVSRSVLNLPSASEA